MAKKFLVTIVALIAIVGLVVGCAPTEPEPEPPGPRTGGAWVDEIVISVEKSDAASVLKMQEGTVHLYGHSISDPDLVQDIFDDPNLDYQFVLGGSRDFIFNFVGPEFPDGSLNPFFVAEIREATQWIIDRDYMVDELLGGMGYPKWTQFSTTGPEQDRYRTLVEGLEAYYAYDLDKGKAAMAVEMENLGAVLVDGKWNYNGEPVVLKQLIRTDLRPYPEAGDYFADQLEACGFTVERLYKTSSEAWGGYLLEPLELGLWNIYGGGWGMGSVYRTEVHSFAQFNTHLVNTWGAPWTTLEPLMAEWPEMYDAIVALRYTDFASMAEREALVTTALTQVRLFANNIWHIELADVVPYRAEVDLVLDKAGGISYLWAHTIHFQDDAGAPVRGGTIHLEVPSFMVQPWNPVEGSAFSYDIMVCRDALSDYDLVSHWESGLYMRQRIERAEVTILTGYPVATSSDWCTLEFEDEIVVPEDAWADWDAENQVWITAAERMLYDEDYDRTAARKSVVYYPDDIFEIPLHDGSILSLADFMMSEIVSFDRGKEASAIFDPAEKAGVEAGLVSFKGWQILSTDPLTIAVYSDVYALDAEHSLSTAFPAYGTYEEFAPWHIIVPGMLAEADKALAFSTGKAEELQVEWMDYTKGPSLDILKARLDQAADAGFIPYEPTMADYMGPLEVGDRYSNLASWYADKGHFWVSNGPVYLHEVFPIGKVAVLKAFDDFPDPSDKWLHLLP